MNRKRWVATGAAIVATVTGLVTFFLGDPTPAGYPRIGESMFVAANDEWVVRLDARAPASDTEGWAHYARTPQRDAAKYRVGVHSRADNEYIPRDGVDPFTDETDTILDDDLGAVAEHAAHGDDHEHGVGDTCDHCRSVVARKQWTTKGEWWWFDELNASDIHDPAIYALDKFIDIAKERCDLDLRDWVIGKGSPVIE